MTFLQLEKTYGLPMSADISSFYFDVEFKTSFGLDEISSSSIQELNTKLTNDN